MATSSMVKAISNATMMKFEASKLKEAHEAQKIIMNHYKTIITSKQYKETSYPYIANMWSIFHIFKNITSKNTASMVTLYSRRIAGAMKRPTLSAARLSLVDKISKELFAVLLPYTGANLVFTKMTDPEITAEELYHLINNITPIGYAVKLSTSTVIFSVLDNEKAQDMASKFDQMNLTIDDEEADGDHEPISSKIRVCYMPQKVSIRTTTFDWSKKASEESYKVEAMGLSVPMRKVLEHSETMRSNFPNV
jgi:hypothetical protein